MTGSYGFAIDATANTADPDASADIVSLPSGFSATSFLISATTYTLQLAGFQNVVGDGFLTSSSTEFHVREQLHATADLYAQVTSRIAAVPEPGSYLLLLAGACVVGVVGTHGRRLPTQRSYG